MILFYILCVLILFGSSSGTGDQWSTESKIWKHLKPDDEKLIPGGINGLNVSCSIQILSLGGFDPSASTVRLGYWLYLKWKIPNLKWDPAAFDGIKAINVPTSKLWVPDVIPWKHTSIELAYEAGAVLNNEGEVLWVPHFFTNIICKGHSSGLPLYPRDELGCELKLGSWSYHGFKLNLIYENPDKDNMEFGDTFPLLSSGWKVLNATSIHESNMYSCCPEPYQSVMMTVWIKRHMPYYSLAISVPGAVVGVAVAILYLLPPTSPARIISQFVCLLICVFIGVTDLRLMGSTTHTAPAAHYFVSAMILDLLAICWSVITAVWWMQTSFKVSSGGGKIDSILSKLECICLLPSAMAEQGRLQLQMDDSPQNEGASIVGLSMEHRLILVLDRIFSFINIILLLLLSVYLSA